LRRIAPLLLTLIVCLVPGCERHAVLRIYVPLAPELFDFGALADAMREETGIEMRPYVRADGDPGPLGLLAAGTVDLTVVENSAPWTPGVRSVLPVYRGVLHVMVRRELELGALEDALRGGMSLFVAGDSAVANDFIDFVARRFGLDPGSINRVRQFEPGKTDLIVAVSSILPEALQARVRGYRLLGFDTVDRLGQGSRVEAIPYLFPQLRPFVIPARTYPALGNEEPVVTVAVDMLLVCREGLPRDTVYELARGLMERRAEFSQHLPELFHTLSDRVDPLALKFPLHPGAADYVNRNNPGFLERYADLISLLAYLLFAVATGTVGLLKWSERRRKDRIDRFYAELLGIRAALRAGPAAARGALQDRLDAIEREAWELLIAEKLSADESFRIFHTLLSETRAAAARGDGA
jgi:hypothetical protein